MDGGTAGESGSAAGLVGNFCVWYVKVGKYLLYDIILYNVIYLVTVGYDF